MRHVAAELPDQAREQHVRRHVAVRALFKSQHAADVRRLEAALEQPAGLHHLAARVVHGRGRVIDGAQQRKLVRVLRHAREDLGDLDARNVGLDGLVRPANLGRRVRLHVPGVELARTAHQHQLNAIYVFLGIDGAGRLEGEELGQRQAQKTRATPACRKSRRVTPSQK